MKKRMVTWNLKCIFYTNSIENLQDNFYVPGIDFSGIKFFVLSVCLSVCRKKLNLGHNFWSFRDRDFIFVIQAQLMNPFQSYSDNDLVLVFCDLFFLKIHISQHILLFQLMFQNG